MVREAEARKALFARQQLSAKGLMGTQVKHNDDQANYKSLGTSLLNVCLTLSQLVRRGRASTTS